MQNMKEDTEAIKKDTEHVKDFATEIKKDTKDIKEDTESLKKNIEIIGSKGFKRNAAEFRKRTQTDDRTSYTKTSGKN